LSDELAEQPTENIKIIRKVKNLNCICILNLLGDAHYVILSFYV
jgi:hypothetical protein